MTSNVLQHRHFDLRQTINFAVEPINNDDLDSERLRWRGRDDCWHYAAQFHVFLSCSGRQSYLRLSLAPRASALHSGHSGLENLPLLLIRTTRALPQEGHRPDA